VSDLLTSQTNSSAKDGENSTDCSRLEASVVENSHSPHLKGKILVQSKNSGQVHKKDTDR